MAIALSVLDALEKEAGRFPNGRIEKVGLRVGELAGVDSGALRFCLEAAVRGTGWEPVIFEIEPSPRRHRCERCGRTFVVTDYKTNCPGCGDGGTVFAGGDELELAYLEVDQNEPCGAGTQSSERK
ncbi:MAG TPA: hydrogenase maturation nickel metallochaperone HypA [Candidatus Dormibacteraeota bacterium]|nr:hydrogenase maturation nickel metallochaperone HypA [Candidatus Dormibacteraeota bacterium]